MQLVCIQLHVARPCRAPVFGAGLQQADGGQSTTPGPRSRQLWLSLYCERWHRSFPTAARLVRWQA